MSNIGLPSTIKTKDDAYIQGVADGEVTLKKTLLAKIRALRMNYEPGSTSPAYENGWYDGRGAAILAIELEDAP